MVDSDTIKLLGVGLVTAFAAFLFGVVAFGVIPVVAPPQIGVLEVLLILLTPVVGAVIAAKLATGLFTDYNTAKVTVEGVIMKSDGGSPVSPGPDAAAADDIVEQIEQADADSDTEALVVELETPGGAPVASDDIRLAAADFDGPTVAYAKDVCASGGYVIACGCDDFFARKDSIVGSIGVNANQRNYAELAHEYGVTRERFVGGEYKDTGDPLQELSEDERDYFQGVIDSAYDSFVDMVAETRDLDREFVSDTEARVYHAPDALEEGLVDHVGDPDDLEALVEDRAGLDGVRLESFDPETGIRDQLSMGAQAVAYSFGRGLASVIDDRNGSLIEFRK
jgi:protease-4